MKVGTDGVLVGAWCPEPPGPYAIDVGTGTGLIALMLAQRFPQLRITAIDAHPDAAAEAAQNFAASPFGESPTRLTAIHCALEDFTPVVPLHLIVSNPPFFAPGLRADLRQDPGRHMARSTTGFTPEALAATAAWLAPGGILAGIYVPEAYDRFCTAAAPLGLKPLKVTPVKPTPTKPPHRVLFAWSTAPRAEPTHTEPLVIEAHGRHAYSDAYRHLTAEFYL